MKTIVACLLALAIASAAQAIDSGTPPPALALSIQPSPARGEAVIAWAPSGFAPVRIEIRDARGRVVRRLEAGINAVSTRWDGRDDRGRTVAAGVYFVKLRAAGLERKLHLVFLR
jgi:hypothetical protein